MKEPVTIRLFFGEYNLGERLSGSTLDKMKDIKVFVRIPGGQQQPVAMQQLAGYWEGTFTPTAEGSYEISGINDEREVQDWNKHGLGIVRPVQYLKTVYQVGASVTPCSSSSLLDLVVNKTNPNTYTLQSFKNNTAFASAKILVMHPDGKETELSTDKDGRVIFIPGQAGLYLVSLEWIDTTPGQFKGKSYETVRHRLDFSLYN